MRGRRGRGCVLVMALRSAATAGTSFNSTKLPLVTISRKRNRCISWRSDFKMHSTYTKQVGPRGTGVD